MPTIPRVQDVKVEVAVGAILLAYEKQLVENRGSSNSLELSKLIDTHYDSLRTLPPSSRCDFFWTIAMNVHFDGAYAYHFSELIAKECREEFLNRANTLLQAPGDFDPRRLTLVKRYVEFIGKL